MDDHRPADPVDPGDPLAWRAAVWNAVAGRMEELSKLSVAPPLAMTGRVLSDPTPRPFWVRLSGSSSPYSGVEVIQQGGTWVDGPRTFTSSLLEVNAVAGLAGKVMRVWPCEPGLWCGQFVRRGGCTGEICFTVTTTTTGSAIVGATVTVYDGPTSGSPVLGTCTTDPYGVCCVPITEAKTYAYSVTKSGGYSTVTGTVAATCTTNDVSVQLVPPAVRCTRCGSDLADTLHVTDPYDGAAVPITWSGSAWSGCRTITIAGVRDASCLSPTTRTIAIFYSMGCALSGPAGNLFILNIGWYNCFASGVDAFRVSDCTMTTTRDASVIKVNDSGATCSPVHATWTMDMTNSFLTPETIPVWGSSPVVFTLSS